MELTASDGELLAAASAIEQAELEAGLEDFLRAGAETLAMLAEDVDVQGQWRVHGGARPGERDGPVATLSWARGQWLRLCLVGGFSPVIGEYLAIREGIEPTQTGIIRMGRLAPGDIVSSARAWGVLSWGCPGCTGD